jgi:hypothetical protein
MFGKSTTVTASVLAAVGLSVAGVVAAAVVGSTVGKTGLTVVGPAPTASVVSGGLMLLQPAVTDAGTSAAVSVVAAEAPECSVGTCIRWRMASLWVLGA